MTKNRSKCRILKIDRMDQKELNITEDLVGDQIEEVVLILLLDRLA